MRIGAREVAHTAILLIPPGEDGWLEFNVGSWTARLKLVFRTVPAKEGTSTGASLELEAMEDHACLTFTNWDNGLGTATIRPIDFARLSDGRTVTAMIWHAKTGDMHRVDLQFLVGAQV